VSVCGNIIFFVQFSSYIRYFCSNFY